MAGFKLLDVKKPVFQVSEHFANVHGLPHAPTSEGGCAPFSWDWGQAELGTFKGHVRFLLFVTTAALQCGVCGVLGNSWRRERRPCRKTRPRAELWTSLGRLRKSSRSGVPPAIKSQLLTHQSPSLTRLSRAKGEAKLGQAAGEKEPSPRLQTVLQESSTRMGEQGKGKRSAAARPQTQDPAGEGQWKAGQVAPVVRLPGLLEEKCLWRCYILTIILPSSVPSSLSEERPMAGFELLLVKKPIFQVSSTLPVFMDCRIRKKLFLRAQVQVQAGSRASDAVASATHHDCRPPIPWRSVI
nr:uncharacterized protein LOC125181175 [Anser cygnoides]